MENSLPLQPQPTLSTPQPPLTLAWPGCASANSSSGVSTKVSRRARLASGSSSGSGGASCGGSGGGPPAAGSGEWRRRCWLQRQQGNTAVGWLGRLWQNRQWAVKACALHALPMGTMRGKHDASSTRPALTKRHGRQRRGTAWCRGHSAGPQRRWCSGHPHWHGWPRHGWRRPWHGGRRQARATGRRRQAGPRGPRRRRQAAGRRRPLRGSSCCRRRSCRWRHARRRRQRRPRRRGQRWPWRRRQAGRCCPWLRRPYCRRRLGRWRQAGGRRSHRRHLRQRFRGLGQRLGGALGQRHWQRGTRRRRLPRPLLLDLLAHQR